MASGTSYHGWEDQDMGSAYLGMVPNVGCHASHEHLQGKQPAP